MGESNGLRVEPIDIEPKGMTKKKKWRESLATWRDKEKMIPKFKNPYPEFKAAFLDPVNNWFKGTVASVTSNIAKHIVPTWVWFAILGIGVALIIIF